MSQRPGMTYIPAPSITVPEWSSPGRVFATLDDSLPVDHHGHVWGQLPLHHVDDGDVVNGDVVDGAGLRDERRPKYDGSERDDENAECGRRHSCLSMFIHSVQLRRSFRAVWAAPTSILAVECGLCRERWRAFLRLPTVGSSQKSCGQKLLEAPSRCLACGEIAKGIDDDAQSTRVRSIGRGDGGLAGVGRLGSSVNHRLA